MIEVECYSFFDNKIKTYLRPTKEQALANMTKTWDTQWDKIEREKISGGVSTVWPIK